MKKFKITFLFVVLIAVFYLNPALANSLEGDINTFSSKIWKIAKLGGWLSLGISFVVWFYINADIGAAWLKKTALGVVLLSLAGGIYQFLSAS